MRKYTFIKKIESMVKPKDTATLQLIAPLIKYIPSRFQNYLIERSATDNPYMAFIVDPYSTFLFYEIRDLDWAQQLIPDGYELTKTKIYADSEPKYYVVFGIFNVRTSAFSGARIEVKIVAKNKQSGLVSWVILDYESNTLSHDQLNGVVESTTEKALYTIDYNQNIVADFENLEKNRALIFDANLKNAKEKIMDSRLWVEGNISIGYGREISKNSSKAFSLQFDSQQVEKAYQIPIENLSMTKNTWYPGLFKNIPDELVCFPYAQHYLSDSPGHYSKIPSTDDMMEKYEYLNLAEIPNYSAEPLRKMIRNGLIFNSIFLFILLFFRRKK